MKVLGIETSCDETGVAIFDTKKNTIVSEQLYSQAAKHALYGGVVPELASRDHLKKLIPLIHLTIKESGYNLDEIDGIAYTAGPGLRGPLLIGASTAKAIAMSLDKPSVGIHHMEAHLLINLLENPAPSFPFLTLLISGGHCLLINSKSLGSYQIIGQTLDDAVGEAFDKVAKILELGYPGGPKIEALARQGNPFAFSFPRPMTNKSNLDFSFSGLKTAVYYEYKKMNKITNSQKADIAASFQSAVADTLLLKTRKALIETGLNELVIGGGVASNKFIRERLISGLKETNIFFPPIERCTDNGAMIAYAGSFYLKETEQNMRLDIKPRWPLSELNHG
ncbi:MAG: tRNA (adenosine(37)-N6)-threonylcarbamoyltransferase complex transferase subunit TsaD [SAR86 cluster bacterium]|jgi:N6-L-threonylcarbamoyladenine synthase|nr:tRNA (adenosine(37)-N6)-threonylcarbamoyltransferase complex transferase subunit TsaD [SAR86 cluster bacterium]|tara:strand:+ start:12310 stop:13320 length:1011 start_codon:yes stop_codon:yes gene_type:complete